MRTFHICLASLVAVIALMAVAMATFPPEIGSAARLTFFGGLAVTGLALHYTGWRALQAAPDADIQASSPVFVQSALYALIAASTIAAVVMLTDGHIVGAVAVLAVGVIPWSALTFWFHTQGWMHDSGPDAGQVPAVIDDAEDRLRLLIGDWPDGESSPDERIKTLVQDPPVAAA